MQGGDPAAQATWGLSLAVLCSQAELEVLDGARHGPGPEVLDTDAGPKHPSSVGPGGGCDWL